MATPDFDAAAANRHFSTMCFNQVWELLEKPDRSPDDDRAMVSMCHASLFHWQQRPDCTSRKLSIGYWQLSRVYAVLGQAENARWAGYACHDYSQNDGPFYEGYAREAIARAEYLAGNLEEARQVLETAREYSAQVTDAAERELLDKDLETVQQSAISALDRWTDLELNILRDSLIAEITEAFRNVSRDGGISWSEAKVLDDYGGPDECAAARQSDNEAHWLEVVDDPNWSPESGGGGVCFLDPIGFRYYLPVGMIRSLRNWEERFDDSAFESDGFHREKLALLDDRQRRCIARYLLYMTRKAESLHCGGETWLKLLNTGWRQYLDPSFVAN